MEAREAKFVKRWRPAKVLSAAESEVKLRFLFPTQDGRAGLEGWEFHRKPYLRREKEISGLDGRGLVGRRAHGSCILPSSARDLG